MKCVSKNTPKSQAVGKNRGLDDWEKGQWVSRRKLCISGCLVVEVQWGAVGCSGGVLKPLRWSRTRKKNQDVSHFLLEFQDEVFLIAVTKRAIGRPQRSANRPDIGVTPSTLSFHCAGGQCWRSALAALLFRAAHLWAGLKLCFSLHCGEKTAVSVSVAARRKKLVFHTCDSGTFEILLRRQRPRVNGCTCRKTSHCLQSNGLISFHSGGIK